MRWRIVSTKAARESVVRSWTWARLDDLPGPLLGLELLVTGADRGLVEALTLSE